MSTRYYFYNGKVYTGDPDNLAQAFFVEDGRFIAVGTNEEVRPLVDEDTVYADLRESFVCPGFNDSHTHLLDLGHALNVVHLSDAYSLEELLELMRQKMYRRQLRRGNWFLGRGWNETFFSDVDRMPTRDDLDSLSSTIPIMITRACGRISVVNSKVLELAGITEDTPDPPDGVIGREGGRLDGRLYDMAIELVLPHLPTPSRAQVKECIRKACRTLNRFGFTSVQTDDYYVFPGLPYEEVNAAYRELEAEGKLSMRGAEASLEEHIKGRIAVGYLADFIVLSRNPFKVAPSQLHHVEPRACFLGGKHVYPPMTR